MVFRDKILFVISLIHVLMCHNFTCNGMLKVLDGWKFVLSGFILVKHFGLVINLFHVRFSNVFRGYRRRPVI